MYKHILIATDGSELATKGLAHGLGMAKTLKADVTIVTTTEIWPVMETAAAAERGAADPAGKYEKAAAANAQAILSAAESEAKQHGLKCQTIHVADQHPAEGIITAARDNNCDLIVIASHGRRGLTRMVLGSVANEVLTHSTIPVIVVR